jgi:hypothetical protein
MGKHDSNYPRIARDFYPTPSPWVVDALAEHVALKGRRVWECACGDGRMAQDLTAAGADVFASDIEDRDCGDVFDFLSKAANPRPCDGVVTNPPYGMRNRLAVSFIEVGLQRVRPSGFLALLLPHDFDCAVTRRHLFADCPAFALKIVLTRRVAWFERPGKRAAPKENTAWFFWNLQARASAPIIRYAPTRRP